MSEYGILSCCGPQPALAQWFKVMGWIKYLEIKPNETVMFPFVRAQGASEVFTQFAISISRPENWPLFPDKIELEDCELLGAKKQC